MLKLTRKQRIALHRKWCENGQGMTYRAFRETVRPYFCRWGCIVVEWCGMQSVIEPNGNTYTRRSDPL